MLAFSFFAVATGMPAQVCTVSGVLGKTVDVTRGEIVVAVNDNYAGALSYLWFIDGKPLTGAPMPQAGRMVFSASKPLPGAACQVVVVTSTQIVASEPMAVTAADVAAATASGTGPLPPIPAPGLLRLALPVEDVPDSVVPPGAIPCFLALGRLGAGEPLTVGFTLCGPDAVPLLLRGVGPSLQDQGIAGGQADPELSLFYGTSLLAVNDNWSGADVANAMQAAGLPALPVGSNDAALGVCLPAGSYSAQATAVSGDAGVVQVDLHDLSATPAARFAVVTARSCAGQGKGPLTAGFIIEGGPKRLLIRCVGPLLAGSLGSGAMDDPKLTLYAGNFCLAAIDNWNDALEPSRCCDAAVQAGAPDLAAGSKDAALTITLPPGAYTVALTGGGDGLCAGTAQIELYDLDPAP